MKKTLAIILALMLSLASVSFSLAETVEPTPLTWWCISSQSDFYNAAQLPGMSRTPTAPSRWKPLTWPVPTVKPSCWWPCRPAKALPTTAT